MDHLKEDRRLGRETNKNNVAKSPRHEVFKGRRSPAAAVGERQRQCEAAWDRDAGDQGGMEEDLKLATKGVRDLRIGDLEPEMLVTSAQEEEIIPHLAIKEAEDMLGGTR